MRRSAGQSARSLSNSNQGSNPWDASGKCIVAYREPSIPHKGQDYRVQQTPYTFHLIHICTPMRTLTEIMDFAPEAAHHFSLGYEKGKRDGLSQGRNEYSAKFWAGCTIGLLFGIALSMMYFTLA